MHSTAINQDITRSRVAAGRSATDSRATAAGTVGEMAERLGPAPIVLLAVWSHPDDETFLAGGLLAVGAIIDRVDPDLIVGFGPDGVTGHADHRAVARRTRQAVADRHDLTPLLTTAAAANGQDVTVFCVSSGVDVLRNGAADTVQMNPHAPR